MSPKNVTIFITKIVILVGIANFALGLSILLVKVHNKLKQSIIVVGLENVNMRRTPFVNESVRDEGTLCF